MKPAVDKITLQEYTEAIRKYYKSEGLQRWQRLGQYLCNSFNIYMSEADNHQIFYETDDNKVMELFAAYIKVPE